MAKVNMVKALNQALFQEMERDADVLVLGEDVGVDGGVLRALEHHSESEEQFYAHIPGLKMVIPSGPRNARALLAAAIRDPDPVIFFEAKSLYHAAKEEVPDESEVIPIGRAQVAREGDALTLVAYGAMLRVALEAGDVLRAEDGAAVEVIDLL